MEQLTLFPVESIPRRSFVYAGVRNGQIKIGVTQNPSRRARQLGLTMLRVQPGDEVTERTLHRRFRAARIDREWFMPTGEVLAWVAGAAA